jgi:beta-barrel assembly-enhancing protease
MKQAWLFAAMLGMCAPAFAQFGNFLKNLDINKAVDITKKAVEANKEYTQEEEIELGQGLTAGFLGAAPLHKDERLQRYVNRVGRWVAAHSERADLPWTFGVIDADTINAFAMPGGTVLVSHGLLKRLQNESELAGVLAHEIAHVVQKHQLKAIQSGAFADLAATVGKEYAASRVRGGGVEGVLKSQLASAGVEIVKNGFFVKPLDRSLEYEADRMGVVLAARAGYDPYGFVSVLQLLAQMKPEDEAGILATHPSPAERMAELEKVVPALERYAGQSVEGRFKQTVGTR